MFRQMAWVVMLLGCVSVAVGEVQNWIYQHNEYYNNPQNPGYPFYYINQYDRIVVVFNGVPNEDFMFEAVVEDGNHQYVGPGDINLVTADDNAGKVELTFVGHNGHPYGAANIKEIRLNQPGVTAVIRELHIAHNLGDLGPIQAARIEGTCTVENEITNDVYLDSLYGELWCLAGLPSLTVSDPTPGPAGTRILIGEVPFAEPPGGGTTTVPWTWPVTWSICISTTPSRAPSTSAGT